MTVDALGLQQLLLLLLVVVCLLLLMLMFSPHELNPLFRRTIWCCTPPRTVSVVILPPITDRIAVAKNSCRRIFDVDNLHLSLTCASVMMF